MNKHHYIRWKSYSILKIFLCIICGVANAQSEEISIIDISQAINIAKSQMLKDQERGISGSDKEIIKAEKYIIVWNDLLKESLADRISQTLRNKLEGRIYWLIKFRPKSVTTKGGSVGIFIDGETSEILYIHRSE